MTKSIVIIQGHPDPAKSRFCRAIGAAYVAGASEAGHLCDTIDVARLEFPLLRTKEEYEKGAAPARISEAQDLLRQANHLVIIFPLWLGDMPALLKGFLEQTFRPGFAYGGSTERGMPQKLLKGKSARIIVTMGMPAFFYRFYFAAHGLKNLKRNILAFCGVSPIRDTVIGMVEAKSPKPREQWLAKVEALGREGT